MNEIAIQDRVARAAVPAPAAESSEADAFLAMVERIARDPNANVEAMEKLLSMRERIMAHTARAAYTKAMAEMKPKLPVIERRGLIVIPSKDSSKPDQKTPFAKWEDIDTAITPVLAAHGFALTFRSGVAQDGKITVTGVLSHVDGHTEETTITLPHDSTGSKNAVQAVGSSTSYGKRYTATLLLNLRTKGEDDDGAAGGAPGAISEEQRERLQALFDETDADVPKFCKFWKIEAVVDLPAKSFDEAVRMLEEKKKRK